MKARNSHVPNERVAGPSLAFHIVRFCASSIPLFAFGLRQCGDDLEGPASPAAAALTLERWNAGTLGRRRLGSPPMPGPGASTDGMGATTGQLQEEDPRGLVSTVRTAIQPWAYHIVPYVFGTSSLPWPSRPVSKRTLKTGWCSGIFRRDELRQAAFPCGVGGVDVGLSTRQTSSVEGLSCVESPHRMARGQQEDPTSKSTHVKL
jgi:hypothetical protein